MIWDQSKGHFVLKSGRTLAANFGSLGVDKFGRMTSGYDYHPFEDSVEPDDFVKPFTLQERADIAEYMKGLWDRWVSDTAGVVEPIPHHPTGGTYSYKVIAQSIASKITKHDFVPFSYDMNGKCSVTNCNRWRDDAIHFQE